VKAAHGTFHLHKVYLAIAGKIEELRAIRQPDDWSARDKLGRTKPRNSVLLHAIAHQVVRTQIALVEPALRLLGEDSGSAFAIQIHPLIASAVQADGQVCHAFCIRLPDWLLGELFWAGNSGVLEFKWRERFFQIAIGLILDRLANVARLCDTGDERRDGAFGIRKLGGAYQAIIDAQLLREMMEREDAAAKAVGAHLEAGAVGGEGILTHGPV
jgi:hypothetical protein